MSMRALILAFSLSAHVTAFTAWGQPVAGDVGIILTVGTTDRYCTQFDGGDEVQNDAELTKRKNAPAPGACP
jgi:hypothetical protein